MRHGFHEDGLASGFEVAGLINAEASMDIAAE
jgi:predicted NAD/FAD-binding protein